MHKLLNIQEDSTRDVQMHYAGAILYDTETTEYMLAREFGGHSDSMCILYKNSKKESKEKTMPLDKFCERVKAVCVYDGYVNLNGYCLFLERSIDGKYKKTTTTNNTSVEPLGKTYIRVHNKRVKREIDAYTVLKAMKHVYYDFYAAIKQSEIMFSVALSPLMAIVKQPLPDNAYKLHLVYDKAYVGEIEDGKVKFVSDLVEELVTEQLKEVGYAAA